MKHNADREKREQGRKAASLGLQSTDTGDLLLGPADSAPYPLLGLGFDC